MGELMWRAVGFVIVVCAVVAGCGGAVEPEAPTVAEPAETTTTTVEVVAVDWETELAAVDPADPMAGYDQIVDITNRVLESGADLSEFTVNGDEFVWLANQYQDGSWADGDVDTVHRVLFVSRVYELANKDFYSEPDVQAAADLHQITRDVYRGVVTVDSDFVAANREQIDENLAAAFGLG